MQIAVYSKLNQGSISFFEMSISFMRQKIEKSPSKLSDYLFLVTSFLLIFTPCQSFTQCPLYYRPPPLGCNKFLFSLYYLLVIKDATHKTSFIIKIIYNKRSRVFLVLLKLKKKQGHQLLIKVLMFLVFVRELM